MSQTCTIPLAKSTEVCLSLASFNSHEDVEKEGRVKRTADYLESRDEALLPFPKLHTGSNE